MKALLRTSCALLFGAALFVSCQGTKPEVVYTMTADRTAISDIAANNPGDETIVLKTNAKTWLVLTPAWVSATPNSGEGSENGIIITLKIASNYKNEATDTAPRNGVLKFSGSGATLEVPISQLGHTAEVDPDASIGGIPDETEFAGFIEAVNEGKPLSRWLNTNGEVELLADINLASYSEWTPIGKVGKSGNGNNASAPTEGAPFSGTFNGGGHTIKNFKLSSGTIADGSTWGLFGYVQNATIKNLNVEAEITLEAEAVADAGILVGTAACSTIENVKVSGKLNVKGTKTDNKRFAVGGIAGFAFAKAEDGINYDTHIKDCDVDLAVTGNSGANTKNGASGQHFGGIVGFCTNPKDDSRIYVEDCSFSGSMNIDCGRCAGIAGVGNYGTIFKSCVNNGNQVNNFVNGREAGLVCVIAAQCAIIDCINNGDLTTTDAQTTAGGMFALLNDNSCYIEGGANYGTILCAHAGNPRNAGLLGANFSKFDHVSGVIVSGKIGTDAGNIADVNEGNFMDFIGPFGSNVEKITNLTFVQK